MVKRNDRTVSTHRTDARNSSKKAFDDGASLKDILADEKKKKDKPIFLSNNEVLNLDLSEFHVKRLGSK